MVIEKGDGLKVNYNCNNNLNSLTDILKKYVLKKKRICRTATLRYYL